ncbi:putative Fe-containing alcohol dehydrogenase [Phyllosticta citribraziliensis]|uniref:Fe-containing alcohol dehydrogenase n=1 Tax=Phyllosticta citribraziliensis TaxID=989973 RepID=A0ABR1LBN9_9PEZI
MAQETVTLPFEGQSHPFVSHGLPFEQACAQHVEQDFKASRVYILASGTLARTTNVVRKLQDALGDKVVGVRNGMTPHTLWSECIEVTKETTQVDADLLVTLGGGSLIDAAKIVTLALANNATEFPSILKLTNNRDPSIPRPDLASPTIPIISIPTSLSGGEFSDHAGGTNDETHHKHGFGHAGAPLGPRLVILDPALVTTTPLRFWLSSGVRAIDHCVETICSPFCTSAAARAASSGLRQLVSGLLRSKADLNETQARLQCQLGVVDAMAGCKAGAPLGASHGIGHQLGPLGVGHGETSCILLPAVCAFNLKHAAEGQHIVLDVLFSVDVTAKLFNQHGFRRGEAPLADCLDVIFRELGMPRRLADFGIGGDEQLDKLAESSLKDRWCVTNAVPLKSKEMVREILNSCSPQT